MRRNTMLQVDDIFSSHALYVGASRRCRYLTRPANHDSPDEDGAANAPNAPRTPGVLDTSGSMQYMQNIYKINIKLKLKIK